MLNDKDEFYKDLELYILGGYKLLETEPADPRSATERMAARPETTSKRQSYIQPPTPDFTFSTQDELAVIRDKIHNIIKLFQLEVNNRAHIDEKLNNELQHLFCMIELQDKRIRELEARLSGKGEGWRLRVWKFEVRIAN